MKSRFFISAAVLFSSLCLFAQNGVVSTNGLLKVDGNQIENKNGTPYSVAGMSMFWSSFQNDGGKFYQTNVVDHLVEEWDIQVIRAAMGVEQADGGIGYISDPVGEYAKVKTIIDAAIANDIYVIVDYHTHYAFEYETQAIKFFTDIATEYGNNDHILYEIFNEPIAETRAKESQAFDDGEFDLTWNNAVKPYAINVINAIREIDPDNMIIVGTPGYSQGVWTAAANPITPTDLSLEDGAIPNIAYTFHFYAGSQYHPALKSPFADAVKQIPIFVTEWGTVEETGSGDVNGVETLDWMTNYLKANNISHANWSISDKAEGASSIIAGKGIQGLLDGEITPSGEIVKCIIENWQADSFENCEAGEVVIIDSESVPNGQGIKIEAEVGNTNTTYYGNSNNVANGVQVGATVEVGEFDGEGILQNLGSASPQFSFFGLKPSDFPNGNYTFQFVVSSNSTGNTITFQRNDKVVNIPNTGGTSNYEIVVVKGIPLESDGDNVNVSLSFNSSGSGTFNFESIYIIADDQFDETALSTPTFDADLAKLINVYPNPVVDYITVDTDEDVAYRIFSLSGSELVAKTEYTDALDVTNLSAGIYFIQLYAKGQTQVYKFVKQ